MGKKIYNFSASPAALPEEVLARVREEFTDYQGSGMSVMELPENSDMAREIYMGAESALRELCGIGVGYRVLFFEGGKEIQYSAIPMNLLTEHKCADYCISGKTSKEASLEAKRYGDIVIATSSAGATPPFSTLPSATKKDFRPDADYVHICYNNAAAGTKFPSVPETGNIPLVADMTTCFLSEPIDVSKFGLIYAASEVNLAAPGITVVIVRDDLIHAPMAGTPTHLSYRSLIDKDVSDTPPLYPMYLIKLVCEWILSVGGLEEMKRRNERKASLLYDYLDGGQDYYTAPVSKSCRSMMNVVFVTGDAELDRRFVAQAEEAGLVHLAADPAIGGMCASIYNSMPTEGVEALIAFMKKFRIENPKINL